MQPSIATHHFFNPETQRALLEHPTGYVNKEESVREKMEKIKAVYDPERFVMMHLGQNPDGCAPEVEDYFRELPHREQAGIYLSEYPDTSSRELLMKLSALHGIQMDWFMLSAGLDQMIDMVAASFIEGRDKFLVTNPGFFLFDEYSRRHGGVPVELNLQEADGFAWTDDSLDSLRGILNKLNLKLIWIANPNNPTGRYMDLEMVEAVVRVAQANYVTVVIDEAYGEYTDIAGGVRSASSLLNKYPNLIVLRTFSKAYGLGSARVGYAMCRNQAVLQALRVHRHYYSISRISLDLVSRAMDCVAYLEQVRHRASERRSNLRKSLAGTPGIRMLDSDCGIGMVRCLGMTADDLRAELDRAGIFAAPVPGSGVATSQYIRITYRNSEDNAYLARYLGKIVMGQLTPPKDEFRQVRRAMAARQSGISWDLLDPHAEATESADDREAVTDSQ